MIAAATDRTQGQQSADPPVQNAFAGAAFAHGAGHSDHDPVEAYFECITTCSIDDGECVTTCTEILREHS